MGLGNPGREYELTRHNVGWWVVDHLADVWRFDGWRRVGEAIVADGRLGDRQVRLVKPQTYMNLSGAALTPYLRRPFWSAKQDLLVVVDEVALPVGRYRLRPAGSPGGHNGLKSVERTLGTQEYGRLRVGIAPTAEHQRIGDLAAFVLSQFDGHEREEIISLLPRFTDAVELWLRDGMIAAMNVHNRSPEPT